MRQMEKILPNCEAGIQILSLHTMHKTQPLQHLLRFVFGAVELYKSSYQTNFQRVFTGSLMRWKLR